MSHGALPFMPEPEEGSQKKRLKRELAREALVRIETIFYCPYEMHELVEDTDVSALLRQMKDDHKEVLFYMAVRRYSAAQIASIRGQTDRNIRKVRDTLLKGLRKKLRKQLAEREKQGLPLTTTQRVFLQEIEKPALDSAKDSL